MRRILTLITVFTLFVVIPSGTAWADDVVVNPGFILTRELTAARFSDPNTGVVWTSRFTGYLVYVHETVGIGELRWIKTTDGGETWSSPVVIQTDGGEPHPVSGFSVWYDRWTQGVLGRKIHIAWNRKFDSNSGHIRYTALDTSDDTTGSVQEIVAYPSFAGSYDENNVSITKTESGYLYVRGEALESDDSFWRMGKSEDNGSSWSTVSSGEPLNAPRPSMLAPAISNPEFSVSEDDIFGFDLDNNKLLQYQEFSDSWISRNNLDEISGSISLVSLGVNSSAGTVASGESDNAYNFYGFINGSIFQILRQNVDSGSELTSPLFTGVSSVDHIAVVYDDNNNDLYGFYLDNSLDQIFYRVSEDWGDTWSVETRFDLTANNKIGIILPSTINTTGGNIFPVWMEYPALVTELDSVTEVTTTSEPDEQEFSTKLDRFVSGTGFTGDTGKIAFALGAGFVLGIIMMVFKTPLIVLLGLELFWFTAMAMPPIEYIPAGIYLSMFLVMGVLFTFLVVRTVIGSRVNGEDF